MTHTLFIKNMVCNRCKMAILKLLNESSFVVETIQLGKITVRENPSNDYISLENNLNDLGFELIKNSEKALIERVKVRLIHHLEKNTTNLILANLENEIGRSYSILSKTFSRLEGITLERYFINLKIEKVKELIQLQELNFSEIAHSLNYQNSSHLAKQFKQVTGMSMTAYKNNQDWNRKSLDTIV